MSNPTTVYLPFNRDVVISVTVSASFLQRVTLTFPDGSVRQTITNGEDRLADLLPVSTTENDNPLGFAVEVKIEYSSDGGATFSPSVISRGKSTTGPVRSCVVLSEDGGGIDFNDAVVVFTWVEGN